ncbi:MAG: hypothetical protein OEV30_10070 [Ignavibacteria bacterium]|nr:hypothetical protein [Ignavibacteria bacterium]
MWNRNNDNADTPKDVEEKEEELRQLLGSLTGSSEDPSPGYWQNLTARNNLRVDEAGSGRAISISWAARVAFPGAIAILFFFIGLHYYVPRQIPDGVSVTEVVSGFSEEGQDSLYRYLLGTGYEMTENGIFYEDLFDPAEEGIEEYLISSGDTRVLLSTFSDEQISELLLLLRTRNENSRL